MTPKAFIAHVLSIAATEPSAVLTEIRGLVQTSIITKPVVGLVLQQIVSGLGEIDLDDLSRLVRVYWMETAALRGEEEAVTLRHIMRAKGELRSDLVDCLSRWHLRARLIEGIRPPVETFIEELGLSHDVSLYFDDLGYGRERLSVGSSAQSSARPWEVIIDRCDEDEITGMTNEPGRRRQNAILEGTIIERIMMALDPLELLGRGAFDRQWRDRDMSEDDLGAIVEALRDAGPFHYGDEDDLLDVALEWLREGFTGAEVEAWTAYPIEDPCWARRLKDREICPHDLDVAAQDITSDAWVESGSSMATFKRETIYRLAELIVDRGFTLEDAREDLFYIAELEMSDYVTGRVLG